MANAEIKVKGLDALRFKLLARADNARNYLDQRLLQLAEEAVTYSKDHKGYKDRTANLKNSISFALFYDGEPVLRHEGLIPKPEESPNGQRQVSKNLDTYAQEVGAESKKGYYLVIVAGMNYGKYVEDKGYNVLYLTKFFLRDEIMKIIEECKEYFLQ